MSWGNLYCATSHNLGPSLIIIMHDGDQYSKKKKLYKKKFIMSDVKF
jgi:hypothetical protein